MPSFFDRSQELRGHFEDRVGPSRDTEGTRFVWDYWHIPGQFTYFRTPALGVIPPSLLAQFTGALRTWGREHLGATRVTVPWLSYYIEGCRQELHTDVVQGTWSYVYSLTPWDDRPFTGGETLLAGERLLDYWGNFDPAHSTETRDLVERIPALFDQLCVFDSRLPHGVEIVEGTQDPLRARVALHGWFQPPEPVSDGPLDIRDAEPTLSALRERWSEANARLGPFFGEAVWRVEVDRGGHVSRVQPVVDNLTAARWDGDPAELLAAGDAFIRDAAFPPSDGSSTVLLPLG